MCMYVFVCMHLYVCVFTCTVCMYLCMCVYNLYVQIQASWAATGMLDVCVCVYMYVCVCMYICMCVSITCVDGGLSSSHRHVRCVGHQRRTTHDRLNFATNFYSQLQSKRLSRSLIVYFYGVVLIY